jgi:hypothetical protein
VVTPASSRMMAKDPRQRPADGAALAEALDGGRGDAAPGPCIWLDENSAHLLAAFFPVERQADGFCLVGER